MAGSDRLATISLCLSVIAAAFTFYQWWNSEREAKINVAIDISRSWVQDNDIAKTQKMIGTLEHVTPVPPIASSEDKVSADHYFSRLEYIAFLINHGKIDEQYVAGAIKCQLTSAPDEMSTLQIYHGIVFLPTPEIRKASPRFEGACYEPHSN